MMSMYKEKLCIERVRVPIENPGMEHRKTLIIEPEVRQGNSMGYVKFRYGITNPKNLV